jgi:hypothetical protein
VNVSIADPGDPAKRAARDMKRRQDRDSVPREVLIEILGYISPDCLRVPGWISVLGAIQATRLRAVNADSMDAELLEIAKAWSRGDCVGPGWPGGAPTNWLGDEDVEHAYWSLDPDKEGGSTFGSLWAKAKEAGYDKPPPRAPVDEVWNEEAVRDHARQLGDDEQHAAGMGGPPDGKSFRQHLLAIRDAAGQGDGPRYDPPPDMPLFMTAAELDAYAFAVEEDVWQGLVLRQLVNLLYGDGKTGKTVLCEHLAVATAAGLGELFGHGVKKMPVLMVLCEDAYKRIRPAMQEICRSFGVNLADLPITFCCRPEDPVLAIVGNKGEFSNELTPFARKLCQQIAALGECLVVLDTVSDIAELDESLRLPPNTLCKKILQPICEVFGATIIVNCHPSEAQIRSGRMTSGATSWKNAVRNVLALTKDKDEVRKLERLYTNYSGNTGAMYLALNGPVYTLTEAPAGSNDASDTALKTLVWHLQNRGAVDWQHGLTDQEAAEISAGPKPSEKDVGGTRDWQTAIGKEKRFLSNKRRSAAWQKFGDRQCQPGGEVLIWKWFAPLTDDAAAGE